MSEVPIDLDVAEREVLHRLAAGNFDAVVLLTGFGTQRLFEEASRVGRLQETLNALSRSTIVARGPKPVSALRRHGLRATHVAAEPNTTAELLATLDTLAIRHQRVLIVSAGEPFAEPAESLRARGAHATELQLYTWTLSRSDASRLGDAVEAIVRGEVGAALFLSQVQVRHLFDVATSTGRTNAITGALREHVVVGAVGPTTARALVDRGIEPDVVPDHPKMGHLVVALAERITQPPIDAAGIASYVRAVLDGLGAPL
jgi:uroporphyrinogen-III synthase